MKLLRTTSSTENVLKAKPRDHMIRWYLGGDHITYSGSRSEDVRVSVHNLLVIKKKHEIARVVIPF